MGTVDIVGTPEQLPQSLYPNHRLGLESEEPPCMGFLTIMIPLSKALTTEVLWGRRETLNLNELCFPAMFLQSSAEPKLEPKVALSHFRALRQVLCVL